MRDVILKSVIVAMLFVAMEGVAEPVDETSFHQTHHTHSDDEAEWFHDTDGNEHEGEGCEHFCHVHVIALTPQVSVPNLPRTCGLLHALPVYTVHRATAPPTPPPNL